MASKTVQITSVGRWIPERGGSRTLPRAIRTWWRALEHSAKYAARQREQRLGFLPNAAHNIRALCSSGRRTSSTFLSHFGLQLLRSLREYTAIKINFFRVRITRGTERQ